MALKNGRYHVRYVPVAVHPPFVGGLYATSTDINGPILAEANPPHSPQVWEVQVNENGKYTIHQPGFKNPLVGLGPVLSGWSVANPSDSFPGGNILLRTNMTEFEIKPVGKGEQLMYSIQVPNPQGGHGAGRDVEFFVTVADRDHALVSQAFWSSLSIHRPHPHWQFIPVHE